MQNVLALEVLCALQQLHAYAQIIELGTDFLKHTQYQPRRNDFVLNHFGPDQLQCVRPNFLLPGRKWPQCGLPAIAGSVYPSRLTALVSGPGIASPLHFRQRRSFFAQGRQTLLYRGPERHHGMRVIRQKALPRLLGDPGSMCNGGGAGHVSNSSQTVAPALGSLGSASFLAPPLIRSSRLMPSHMAMAAATKTDE